MLTLYLCIIYCIGNLFNYPKTANDENDYE